MAHARRRRSPTRAGCETASSDGPHASRSPAAAARSARWTTTARTRAARSARARSRTGWLRCPWHGYDYDPITGTPPAGFTDAPPAYPVEERADGVYVALPDVAAARAHGRPTCWSRRWSPGASTHVFGMVGHSNLGFADAMRRAEERGELTLHRHPPRGRGRVRRVSAYGKLTGRPAACFAIAGPGLDQPAHRPVRRQARPRAGARDLRAGAVEGARPGRVPGPRPVGGLPRRRGLHDDRARRQRPRRAGRRSRSSTRVDGRGVAHLVLPDEVQVLPVATRPPARRTAGCADRRIAPDAGALDAALDRLARRPPPGDRRRPRRARAPMAEVRRAGRAARRPGAHHVQGQGPGARHPPARRRRARPQRHARWRAG